MTNTGTGTWRAAIDLDELWEGDMAGVEVAGVDVLLVNLDGRIRAYENRCPHQGGALDEGDFDGSTIICGRHLWEFDADSGAGINPAGEQLTTYPCRVTDDTVEVNLPS